MTAGGIAKALLLSLFVNICPSLAVNGKAANFVDRWGNPSSLRSPSQHFGTDEYNVQRYLHGNQFTPQSASGRPFGVRPSQYGDTPPSHAIVTGQPYIAEDVMVHRVQGSSQSKMLLRQGPHLSLGNTAVAIPLQMWNTRATQQTTIKDSSVVELPLFRSTPALEESTTTSPSAHGGGTAPTTSLEGEPSQSPKRRKGRPKGAKDKKVRSNALRRVQDRLMNPGKKNSRPSENLFSESTTAREQEYEAMLKKILEEKARASDDLTLPAKTRRKLLSLDALSEEDRQRELRRMVSRRRHQMKVSRLHLEDKARREKGHLAKLREDWFVWSPVKGKNLDAEVLPLDAETSESEI